MLSKHKMWDYFLLNFPNIWCIGAKTRMHEKSPGLRRDFSHTVGAVKSVDLQFKLFIRNRYQFSPSGSAPWRTRGPRTITEGVASSIPL